MEGEEMKIYRVYTIETAETYDDYIFADYELTHIYTKDKDKAEKIKQILDGLIQILYTEEHTIESNKVDHQDALLEIEKLKKQIEVRDKEILNRDKTINQMHTKIMNLKQEPDS